MSRTRIFASLVISLIWATATGALAQSAVPEFRYLGTRDMDFYGSDLDALFDTDLASCVRACSANPQCTAFTFNARSSSCFPKSGVSDQTPYQGAMSAQKVSTDRAVVERSADRADALVFLKSNDLNQAFQQARDLGLRHPGGDYDLQTVLEAVRNTPAKRAALNWAGLAVALSDRADLWTDYAARLSALDIEENGQRRAVRQRALSASINGYLRSASPAEQVNALVTMATVLEQTGRGRDMIPALRLAATLQTRQDVLAALDSAVGKYGFRIVDSTVESDAAAPRICAQFSDTLAKAGVDYEPFVQLPSSALVVQAEGNQLCVDGVEHGTRYRMTFRQGLPAATGETLHKDVTLTHYVRDRSPSVRFPGRSYVLPRTADAALPVETVNLTELDLQLRRISDRNLLRSVQDGFFGRPLSQWQDEQFSSEIAEEVWTGTAEVETDLNRNRITRLPMADAIAGRAPGIYALTARVPGADPYDDPGATQWFVLSDLGLSTMSGTDGLHVTVRSLGDAAALANIDVTLISRANAVLSETRTDNEGYAHFAAGLTRGSGASAPALIVARNGDSDLSFLSLTDPAFDLSDRGVEGRPPAGPVDVFLTTDRGAYRAGETIYATALSRDGEAQAIDGLPLTAILSRPDGVEYLRRVSDGGQAGGHVFALPVGS
ncbi:MAG: MG2 domain-containing protein, partial [Pseudomonadota bacterium]